MHNLDMFYVKRYRPQPEIEGGKWIVKNCNCNSSGSNGSSNSSIIDVDGSSNTNTSQNQNQNEKELKNPSTNIGSIDNSLVFEIDLCGFKKENIKIGNVGNVISVDATWQDVNSKEIEYAETNIFKDNVSRKFYLSKDYLNSTLKWNFINGLLTIVVTPKTIDIDIDIDIDNVDDYDDLFSDGD